MRGAHEDEGEDQTTLTKQTSEAHKASRDMGLFVAVGLGAFVLGGFVIGAVMMWRMSDSRKPSARKPANASAVQKRGMAKAPTRAQPPQKSATRVGTRRATPPAKNDTTQRSPKRLRPPSRRGAAPSPRGKAPDRTRPRPRASASSGGHGQMWGAPNWIFDPWGGLIGKLRLLSPKEVKAAVGFVHLRGAILQGIPRSGTYDAVQFRPTKPLPKAPDAQFGLGVQLWLHPQAAPIVQRWRRYQRGYPNARMLPKGQRIGRDSFVAKRAPILYLLFRTSRRHGLVILSCHQALCSRKALVTLAKRIDKRIQ